MFQLYFNHHHDQHVRSMNHHDTD
uniref:Uncharacterized protein n=1 Tax=Tetranychus urticae TaxID=32264 RepID=T1KU13_TETUR